MKLKQLLSLLLLLGLVACKNDLDITDDWKDVTVVYGLLDANADTNFIRVERGYLGSEPAANSFDKPDSIYYSNLDVVLNWYSGSTLESSVKLIEDRSRKLNDNGPFLVGDHHRLYRVPDGTPIDPNFRYEVVITKPNESVTSASTNIINASNLFVLPAFISQSSGQLPVLRSGDFRFKHRNSDVAFYETYVNFYYREYDKTTKQTSFHNFRFRYGSSEEKSNGEYTISGGGVDGLFNAIANRIPVKSNVYRFYDKIKVEIWGADDNLYTYARLNTPATGINQNRPDFTNVNNGIGIFASRMSLIIDDIVLSDVGTPESIKDQLILNDNMCSRNFLLLQGTDSCQCKVVNNITTRDCF